MKKGLLIGVTSVVLSFLCLCMSCASAKSQNTGSSVVQNSIPLVASGVLRQTEDGGFVLVAGERTKNRVTYALRPSAEKQEVYDSLSDFVGAHVTVTGVVHERKSRWAFVVEVVSVTSLAE
ncbi:MAG: hypothetical protein IJ158_04515 [Treponema sp.]|nr:hypothetical protein [Treponema sp.]